MAWIFLITALSLNALANILIKAGMRAYTGKIDSQYIIYLISNKFVIFGLLSFGAALFCYSYTLSKMSLSVAYPIMTGCGFAIVVTVSYFAFGEAFSLSKLIGIVLVFLGIVFLAR